MVRRKTGPRGHCASRRPRPATVSTGSLEPGRYSIAIRAGGYQSGRAKEVYSRRAAATAHHNSPSRTQSRTLERGVADQLSRRRQDHSFCRIASLHTLQARLPSLHYFRRME